jgi:integrase
MYRVGGRLVRETIGTMANIPNVADARALASASMKKAQAGTHPIEEKRRSLEDEVRRADEAALVAVARQRDTIENVVAEFMKRYMRGRKHSARYVVETQRNFDKHVLPRWRDRDIKSISRRDLNDLLDTIVDEGKPVAANRVLSAVRKLFNWSIQRGIIEASPAWMIERPSDETKRERTLTPNEIRTLWAATETLGYPFGAFFRMALATGQRRSEVATMRWHDIDTEERIWTLPAEMTKAGRSHVVPLSRLAMKILSGCRALTSSPYVFSSRKSGPIAGYSKAKQALDSLMTARGDIESWTIHDLRRSVGTGLGKRGVSRFVIARVLNHADSTVTAIYDRHEYLPEKREALEKWGGYLEGLIQQPPENVVPMPRRAEV